MRRRIFRLLRALLVGLLAAGGAGLILASPLGLKFISVMKIANWPELSSIGQTYGAISALISGIALAGIAISLFLQSRELNLMREQIFRDYHFDLVRFSIENPSFISSWGYAPSAGLSLEDIRRVGYTNMIVSFWSSSYLTGHLDESELRRNCSQMFQGEVGRSYWEDSRKGWHESGNSRRSRRFARIVEEEYCKSVDSGPSLVAAGSWSAVESAHAAPGGGRLRDWHNPALAFGFGAGFLAAIALRAHHGLPDILLRSGKHHS